MVINLCSRRRTWWCFWTRRWFLGYLVSELDSCILYDPERNKWTEQFVCRTTGSRTTSRTCYLFIFNLKVLTRSTWMELSGPVPTFTLSSTPSTLWLASLWYVARTSFYRANLRLTTTGCSSSFNNTATYQSQDSRLTLRWQQWTLYVLHFLNQQSLDASFIIHNVYGAK